MPSKELKDRQEAQDKELRDREDARRKEVEAQDKELRAQAEERFKIAVTALGDKNEATQIGGAILLRSFLNKQDKKLYEHYYAQIFDLAVAYLRLRHVNPDTPEPLDSLTQALATVLKEAFPLARALFEQSNLNLLNLDAIGVRLDNAYLARSDLKKVRLPEAYLRKVNFHEADLREANLREAKLYGAKLTQARLMGANLTVADLRHANLSKAQLKGANLDGANLSGANLRGATIEDALSLKNTNLHGVTGLTKEELLDCKAMGAIIDETTRASAP